MKKTLLLTLSVTLAAATYGQKPEDTEDWSREPEVVTPGKGTQPPSDAIVLYGKKGDLDHWINVRGGPATWTDEGVVTVVPGTGGIKTKKAFRDVQLHVEWRTPEKLEGDDQGRGNSGVFLMSLYEIQVLDSYENETYYNGQAGSIYKQHIPLVNACKPPGEWQTYDIIFKAPKFGKDGSIKVPAFLTVIQNGVLIQNHVELEGPMQFIGKTQYKAHPEKLPLMLQEHGNPVSYRNIWIREL